MGENTVNFYLLLNFVPPFKMTGSTRLLFLCEKSPKPSKIFKDVHLQTNNSKNVSEFVGVKYLMNISSRMDLN